MDCFPSGLKGVIFDCDGVMIDSSEANTEYYNRILDYFGLPRMTREQADFCIMATVKESLAFLLPEECQRRVDEVRGRAVDYCRDIMPLIKIYPGFLAFIDFLNDYKIKMAVLTNRTRRGMAAVLDFFSFPPYFYPVITASDGFPKPHPGGAELVLKAWGLSPSDVLYVGDSPTDEQTADAAGIPFAAIGPAEAGLSAFFHVDGYPALQDLLGRHISKG